MRGGLDVILGGLLLSSGLLAPGLLTTDDVLDPSSVAGSATFDVAHYRGPGGLQASEAALEAIGPLTFTLSGQDVVVEPITRKEVAYEVHNDDLVHARGGTGWVSGSTDRFDNATIEVRGFEDGELQAWPNASLGSSTFDLTLGAQDETTITAVPGGAHFVKDEVYDHQLPAPTFALGHNVEARGLTPASPASFQELAIEGGIDLIVDNGTVTVTHEGGTKRYEASDGLSQSDPTGHVTARENGLVVLSLRVTKATLGFDDDIESTFFAHEPEWTVNGTLRFEAQDGRLSAGATNRSLANDLVAIVGQTNLSLKAQPTNNEQALPDRIAFAQVETGVNERHPSQASFQSEADNISVAGEPVHMDSSSPAIPEEVTFWGKILGLLMLAASIVKKLFGLIAPLVINNPLGNDRRKRIFAFLKEAGMAHRREIHRATGIPNASLEHHLHVLCEHDLIVEVKENGYTVYFPTSGEFAREDMEKLAYLADESRRTIAERLVEWDEGTQAALIEDVGLSQSQVSRQLAKLVDASLVREVEDWPRSYQPSELLRRWVGR